MPFNGSGVYAAPSLPGSWNPATTGSSATPADWNTLLADISAALSTTITKDGQTTITADIPMGNHKITGLADATAQTDALNQQSALYLIDQQDATTVSFVDFVNLAATVNNLKLMANFTVSANNTTLILQTYGADGVLDTGGTDYIWIRNVSNSGSANPGTDASSGDSSITTGNGILNTTQGITLTLEAANIQALSRTSFLTRCQYGDQGGANFIVIAGSGTRTENDRITGLRLSISSGTITGKATLFGGV